MISVPSDRKCTQIGFYGGKKAKTKTNNKKNVVT